MRGYKIFEADYTCRGYKYSLNTPNVYNGDIKPCVSGFHFCPVTVNCLRYYSCVPENTYAEVECGNEYIVDYDKVVCSELKIVKTLTFEEFSELATGAIKTPTLECNYVCGLLEGSYKEWCGNGQLCKEATYVRGILHGSYKEWYANGKSEIKTTYVNGKRHGSYKEWYPNGQLDLETTYVDGKIHGIYKEWQSDEQSYFKTIYVDGKMLGNDV